jgi:OOP family OmpA-OmpF porin
MGNVTSWKVAPNCLRGLLVAICAGAALLAPRALAQEAATPNAPAAAAEPDRFGVDDEFDGLESGDAAAPRATASAEVTTDGEVAAAGDSAAADSATAVADSSTDPAAADATTRRRARLQNSLRGSVGGLHAVDARSGPVGSFRLQLHTEFFVAKGFLNKGDENSRVAGALSLSATLMKALEVYASVWSFANSNDTEDPELFQALGDATLGVKGFADVLPWLTLGGDLQVDLLNRVGGLGVSFAGTGIGLRGNATADFREIKGKGFPLIARLNLQYYFDNSSSLIKDTEDERYAALDNAAPEEDENRHLVSRVERFALGINRTDFLNVALGFEAPLEVNSDFVISPLLEWTWAVPVNRQGYNCIFIPDPNDASQPAPGDDGCLELEGAASFPMDLTLGVRVAPPVPGLSLFAALDIGLTGTGTFVRELAANAPYNVMLGLGYAYDQTVRMPRVVVREVEKTKLATLGRVRGVVVQKGAAAATPVSEAVVRFLGANSALTSLLAGDDGTFVTYAFEPGEVQMELSHPQYETATCSAVVPAKGDVDVRCELTQRPQDGSVSGRVVDEGGAPVAVEIRYEGPSAGAIQSDTSGAFTVPSLAEGRYTFTVSSPEYLVKQDPVDVRRGAASNLEIRVTAKPKRAAVEVRDGDIRLKKQINFGTRSSEINPNSFPLLEEIADALLRNPDIAEVEIQGHTDNIGKPEANKELSQRRADEVRTWLTMHGVDGGRLTATGYGMEQPIAPNITAQNRARNRRVEFIIKRRQ